MRRDGRYLRRFTERLGSLEFFYQPTAAGAVWLHAVSVGEVISAVPLVAALRKAYPGAPVFVSCSTVAGRAIAIEKLRDSTTAIFYAPLDYVSCVRRVLRKLRPSLVIVMETEIWPNLYREAKRHGAALAIVNGRISDRAFPSYRHWAWAFEPVLSEPDAIFAQSEQDRLRYLQLGAPADRVHVAGNLKYDIPPQSAAVPEAIANFVRKLVPGEICIAASTMPPRDTADVDEDDIVIEAFRKLAPTHPGLLLILVPRRPERFEIAARKLDQAGVNWARRSQLPSRPPALPSVLLLDSMGELSSVFPIGDVVFMGGTLARRGGHNILEPAFAGNAIIAGPHMENFASIADQFTAGHALVRIPQPADLAPAIHALLSDDVERNATGNRARVIAESDRGATERICGKLLDLYFQAIPRQPSSAPMRFLAALWSIGSRRRRERDTASQRRLDQPVIAIGGITMGGTGKTPFTGWLAQQFRDQGLKPAILTRGYRRRSIEPCVIVPAGASANADLTGDEPQSYIRQAAAHVGIGADRYSCARSLSRLTHADIFLLDDGFQHWRLARDLDIVLIDALDPFGQGSVFPAGRLREPLQALGRASAFVITRVEHGFNTAPIERELRIWNPAAPVFRSCVKARHWIDARTGRTFDAAPFKSAGAFCGLANPRAFWRTLDTLGVDVRFHWAFADHHRYRMRELQRLTRRALHRGAQALVTTEKDVANLGRARALLNAPLPIYALEIAIEILERDRLMTWAGEALERRGANR